MGYYPLVSVIIATYNAGKYLRRALDSVYSQSYTNVECIVVDGCSKDNTLYKPQNKMFRFYKTFCSRITLINTNQNVILNPI